MNSSAIIALVSATIVISVIIISIIVVVTSKKKNKEKGTEEPNNCIQEEILVTVGQVDGSNRYAFNDIVLNRSKINLGIGTYIFKDVPKSHPLAILNANVKKYLTYTGVNGQRKAVTGTTADGTYDFYTGDITVTITGDFDTISVYCLNHGYMGGQNALEYDNSCQGGNKNKTPDYNPPTNPYY